jgi:hypothetical protein
MREVKDCLCPLQVSGSSIVLGLLDASCWIDGVEYRLTGKVPPHEPLQRLLAGGIAGAFSRTGAPAAQPGVLWLPLKSSLHPTDLSVSGQAAQWQPTADCWHMTRMAGTGCAGIRSKSLLQASVQIG